MKAKVLHYSYSDGSGEKPVRVYLESEYEKAESDLLLMNEFSSDCKDWELTEVELIGTIKQVKE
jgi:hypothetical protein